METVYKTKGGEKSWETSFQIAFPSSVGFILLFLFLELSLVKQSKIQYSWHSSFLKHFLFQSYSHDYKIRSTKHKTTDTIA